MLKISTRNQIYISGVLVTLMLMTRGHHFAGLHNLPGASWAVFFLAGIYLQSRWSLFGMLALTWVLDFASYQWGGGSNFCFTRSYVLLLPAYAALWLAGHWYAKRYSFTWNTLFPLMLSVLIGAVVCELLSSGGFYFFSGRFAEPTFTEFGSRIVKYFPSYIQSLSFYVGLAIIVHVLFRLANNATRDHATTKGQP